MNSSALSSFADAVHLHLKPNTVYHWKHLLFCNLYCKQCGILSSSSKKYNTVWMPGDIQSEWKYAFSTCYSRKSTGDTNNSSVPVSRDSVTVSQHAQSQDPETEADKWNSAIVRFIICTWAFPTFLTCALLKVQRSPDPPHRCFHICVIRLFLRIIYMQVALDWHLPECPVPFLMFLMLGWDTILYYCMIVVALQYSLTSTWAEQSLG